MGLHYWTRHPSGSEQGSGRTDRRAKNRHERTDQPASNNPDSPIHYARSFLSQSHVFGPFCWRCDQRASRLSSGRENRPCERTPTGWWRTRACSNAGCTGRAGCRRAVAGQVRQQGASAGSAPSRGLCAGSARSSGSGPPRPSSGDPGCRRVGCSDPAAPPITWTTRRLERPRFAVRPGLLGQNRARRARFTGRRGSRLLGPIMVLCLTCYDAQNNTDAEQCKAL